MKNLKDYIGKPFNIICDNKEEWDAIVEQAIKLNYLVGGEKNTSIKEGYSPDKYLGLNYKGNLTVGYLPNPSNRTVIKASEFISPYFKDGTYIVALIDNAVYITGFNTGCIGVIKDTRLILYFETICKNYFCSKRSEKNGLIKSFKTKEEAETFAETLKPKTMTLLDEAYKRYPIGTKFISKTDNGLIREIKPYGTHNTVKFELTENNKIWCSNGLDIGKGGCCSNPFLYEEGKWVEIVETTVIETPKEVDKWIGKIVRITQNSTEKGKTGKVLRKCMSTYSNYYVIENLLYDYTEDQFEEVIETSKVEYIEIVKQSVSPKLSPYKEVIGEIFKVVKEGERDYYIKDLEGNNDVVAKNRVKPSTKEAYEKQVTIENKITKVPRYLEWVDNVGNAFNGFMVKNEKFINGKIFDTFNDECPHTFYEKNWNLFFQEYSFNFIKVSEAEYRQYTGSPKMFPYEELPAFPIREMNSEEYIQHLEEEIPRPSPTQTISPIRVPLFLEEE